MYCTAIVHYFVKAVVEKVSVPYILCFIKFTIFSECNKVLYSRTKGVKRKYLLYISSIGSCIFLLLVAGHKYLQYLMFKYTAVHGTPNSELVLHCSTLVNLEDRYMSTMSYITVSGWSLSVLSISPVLVTV